ncbi:MAG: ankyrin repeat domain-containing protein [marine benthic group bacterium]|jgi:ankyrin repeat protein|nr:ankyrin repeat domain-containing protein [Candidatus Benthicola marisminoris]
MDPCDVLKLHEAYVRGELEAVRRLLGDLPDFPNCPGPHGAGEIVLEYAIYHSPIAFVETLLDLGSDPVYGHHAGYPAVIAALSSERPDRLDLVALLLDRGADIQQRGVNGYTPLHWAAAENDPHLVEWLLARGADPRAKTNVDDYATPLEEALILGNQEAARALRAAEERKGSPDSGLQEKGSAG